MQIERNLAVQIKLTTQEAQLLRGALERVPLAGKEGIVLMLGLMAKVDSALASAEAPAPDKPK